MELYFLIPATAFFLLFAMAIVNWEHLLSGKGKRVCSWCNIIMGESGHSLDTHGLCEVCAQVQKEKLLKEVERLGIKGNRMESIVKQMEEK